MDYIIRCLYCNKECFLVDEKNGGFIYECPRCQSRFLDFHDKLELLKKKEEKKEKKEKESKDK